MAVLGRLLVSSAERLDLPDLLSIDSYAAGDWKYFLKGMVGDSKPFILKGFDVIDPNNAIGEENCAIRVANSVVFYPGSSAGSFFHGLEEGHEQAAPLIPELRKNATNYVYLTFTTLNTSTDTRAFWDPDKDGGAGGEFTQDINTESILKVEVNVSVGSFPANTIPVAIIKVGALTIESIKDARHMLFRLGTGGLSPDPFNDYAWRSLPSATFQRTEPATAITSGTGDNPFQGADKNIQSMKEWMDAVMSKLRELGGTTYWYEDVSTFSVVSTFIDSCSTAFKSKGRWIHDSGTPGDLTWTEDINLKVTSDLRTYIIRAGNGAPFTGYTVNLADEEVLYVEMVRNQPINTSDQAVQWTAGSIWVNTVGGAVGLFSQLKQGDWIKKINDSNDKFLRVEEFYDGLNGGSATSAANAKSIKLSSSYAGTTAIEKARYDQGEYLASDTVVSTKDQAAISAAGGNFHWLATRSDTIQKIGSIVETSLSVAFSDGDGDTVKVTSTGAHGLNDGDWIRVSGSTGFDGDWQVEVESSTVFYINSSIATPDSGTATYATVTTVARDNGDGFQLESANHGLRDGDKITISGTAGHDGVYLVNSASGDSFRIAGAGIGDETAVGLATLARLIVRTEGSVVQVVQGQTVDIGASAADNMRQYIGMSSLTEVNPLYVIPPSYNTLDGMANYNSTVNENLTTRVAKLTAMMADKAQDRTMQLLLSGTHSVYNTTNGSDQDITFSTNFEPPQRLDIVLPGSDFTSGSVSLTGTITLAVNQAAYIEMDRNDGFSIALNSPEVIVTNIVNVPISENILVLAIRLSSTDVWLWNGIRVTADRPALMPNFVDLIVQQNRTLKLVRGGQWSWDLFNASLYWSADAYIQVPGLTEDRNTISSSNVTLSADGEVVYVDINRDPIGGAAILTVNVAGIDTLDIHPDRVIIARRIGDSVEVGTGTMMLQHGETRSLDYDSKIIRVNHVDVATTMSLPSGTDHMIDGNWVEEGQKVLFTDSNIQGIYMVSGVGSGLVWTQLDVFSGSVNPSPGYIVYCENGNANSVTLWHNKGVDSNWQQLDNTEIVGEPTGFVNRTDSVLSFSDITHELTISLAPTATQFEIYQRGRPYKFNTSQFINIPAAQGLHYIYFDGPTLYSTQTFTVDLLKQYVFVATLYWDATTNTHIALGDERHGLTMDSETHGYLHQSVGARYISGLSAGDFTTSGTGASNSDATLSISGGIVRDEDISLEIVNSDNPVLASNLNYTSASLTIMGVSPAENGQQFTAVRSGTIDTIDLPVMFARYNVALPASGSVRIKVYTDSAGIPGTLLSTTDIDVNSFPESPDVVFALTAPYTTCTLNPASVTSGGVYWFSLSTVSLVNCTVGEGYQSGGGYTGGIYKYYNGTTWSTPLSFDLAFNIKKYVAPVVAPAVGQNLSPIANIPVYYRSGASGGWKKVAATNYPLKQGSSRIQWNNPAGPWTTVDASADGNYVAMWIFATNDITEPVIAVLGQRQDTTLNDAQANNVYESISFGDMPSAEMKVIYRLIYKTSSAYTNTPKALLADVRDLRRAIDTALGAYAPSDHGLLSGLTDKDHPDYSIFVQSPAAYTGALKQINVTDNNDVQKSLQSLDKFFGQLRLYPHPSNTHRVKISSSDHTLTNNITLTQTVKSLMMAFDGAEIDFSTGSIYTADGVTALGINFTPTTIPSGSYSWYAIGLKTVSPALANNTINVQVLVTPASGTNAVLNSAPRAKFKGSVKLGQVWVKNTGGSLDAITASNIYQLGVGSGGGGGGEEVYDFTLVNNQSSPANVVDFLVEAVDNKMFKAEYSIARRYSLAASNVNGGALDTSFAPVGTGFNALSTVNAIAVQSLDGKILAGGGFTSYNGTSRPYIARLNSDGSLDTSFVQTGTGLNNIVYASALQTDGKVLVGGTFTSYNGTARPYIARLNSDGSLDTSFVQTGTGLDNLVTCIAIQSDGKILVGGGFTSYNGTSRPAIVRLNSNGSLDTSFVQTGTGFSPAFVRCMAIQPDGKVLVGGEFTSYNGTSRPYIARLNSNGSLDTSFVQTGTGLNNTVHDIALQPDGKVLVGGTFTSYNGTARAHIARLDSLGALDTTFVNSSSNGNIQSVALQSDGKVLVGGAFTLFGAVSRPYIARLDSLGALDTTFVQTGTGLNFYVYDHAIVVQSDGKILAGGGFNGYNGTARQSIVRLTTDVINPAIESEYMTQGSISGIYRPSTSTWTLQANTYTGDDPEVSLSITSAGQVQYTSSNLPGTELESMIKFKITGL